MFGELSVNKLWNHFKTNETVLKYLPEYSGKQYPEHEFFFNILSTIYPKEVENMIEAAYKLRKQHYKKNHDEMIEITDEFKEQIKSVIVYRSK